MPDNALDVPLAERIQRGAVFYGGNLRHYDLGGISSGSFERAVAMLSSRGCRVALVETPLTTPLRAMITPDVQVQFTAYVQRLENNYGCIFVDLSDRLPDTDFVDVHHASIDGSREFCQILAREIIAPVWNKR